MLGELAKISNPYCSVNVENPTPYSRLQWCRATIPFAVDAEMNEQKLSTMVAEAPGTCWKILKHHIVNGEKGGIALAQAKFPINLGPKESRALFVGVPDKPQGPPQFEYSPYFIAWLIAGGDRKDFEMSIEIEGKDPIKINLLSGVMQGIYGDQHEHIYKFRQRLDYGLSATLYVTIESLSPIVKCRYVIGNDIMNEPVYGGFKIRSIAWPNGESESYPVAKTLCDGQQLTRTGLIFCVPTQMQDPIISLFGNTYEAEKILPLYGFADYETHRKCQALGSIAAKLPEIRWTDKQAALEFVKGNYAFRYANDYDSSFAYLGMINGNPGQTGAQSDFSATVHPMLQATLQLGSLEMFNRAMMMAGQESLRPFHYFIENRRIKSSDFPDAFFWSSRPHWHPGWNPEYPILLLRTGAFNIGELGIFNSEDNQHYSNNGLRNSYELSGDPYLGEICHYYVSITRWNFFTKKYRGPEAERCTRLLKESLLLAQLFIDTPEAKDLMEAHPDTQKVFADAIDLSVSKFGLASITQTDACDPRTNNRIWCPTGETFSPTVAGCWMMGFTSEYLALCIKQGRGTESAIKMGNAFLDSVPKYFAEDGSAHSLVLLTDPMKIQDGGIGAEWWAGWMQLAQALPEHVNSAFVLSKVKSWALSAIDEHKNEPVSFIDAWRSF